MTPRRTWCCFLLALAVLASAILAADPPLAAAASSQSVVSGSATYRERIALTKDALFEAILEDVSRSDAPAERIARVRLKDPGQVPIKFEIRYDPQRIEASKRYAVRFSIYEGSELRFVGVQSYPVLTHGHGNKVQAMMRSAAAPAPTERGPGLGELPATFAGLLPCADCAGIRCQIDLGKGGGYVQRMTYMRSGHDDSYYELGAWSLSSDRRTLTLEGKNGKTLWAVKDARTLRKLDRSGKPIDSKLPYELTRQAGARPVEPRAQLSGMFRYMADAARFRDCRSGLEWPVAMSEDYPALERAYTTQRGEPGAELLVSIDARIEHRPRMEGEGTEATLVVEKFLHAKPGENCAGRITQTSRDTQEELLGNNRWVPVRIGDHAVTVESGQREPWIELEPRSRGVTGSGGCNRFTGGYESGDGTLRFDAVAATQMACASMRTETDFLLALEATRRYRVYGRTLELMDDRGRVLVRLEERNLK